MRPILILGEIEHVDFLAIFSIAIFFVLILIWFLAISFRRRPKKPRNKARRPFIIGGTFVIVGWALTEHADKLRMSHGSWEELHALGLAVAGLGAIVLIIIASKRIFPLETAPGIGERRGPDTMVGDTPATAKTPL